MNESLVLREIDTILPSVLTVRHHLHAHPELALQEFGTARYLRDQLTSRGITPLAPFLETDVVALLSGSEPGRNVTLRADMDALPLTEQTGLAYRSTVPGLMHACGHDGHCAMLLGAAFVLQSLRHHLRGSVRFVFQPGEEVAAAGRDLVQAGALDGPKPDAILALHGWAGLPAGALSSRPGPLMAAADFFRITITGKGGHGSRPERAVNPILIAARLIDRLYDIPAHHIGALDPVVITVCSIHGGQSSNVIPEEVVLEGTVRYLSKGVGEQLPDLVRRLAEGECAAGNGSCAVLYERPYIPTINDREIVAVGRRVAEQLPDAAWLEMAEPSMGAEDFSYYLEKAPGALFFLGMGEESPQIHNNCFDFNDAALRNGIRFLVAATLEILG